MIISANVETLPGENADGFGGGEPRDTIRAVETVSFTLVIAGREILMDLARLLVTTQTQ